MTKRSWCLLLVVVACISSARKGRVNPYTSDDLLFVGRHYVPKGAFDKAFAKGDCTRAPDHPQVKLFCEKKCNQLVDRDIRALCTGNCSDTSTPEWKQFCNVLANQQYYEPAACDGIATKQLESYCFTANSQRPARPRYEGGGGGGGGGEGGGEAADCIADGNKSADARGDSCCSGNTRMVDKHPYPDFYCCTPPEC